MVQLFFFLFSFLMFFFLTLSCLILYLTWSWLILFLSYSLVLKSRIIWKNFLSMKDLCDSVSFLLFFMIYSCRCVLLCFCMSVIPYFSICKPEVSFFFLIYKYSWCLCWIFVGIPIDKVAALNQDTRDYVGKKLLELTLKELFIFRFMQAGFHCSSVESTFDVPSIFVQMPFIMIIEFIFMSNVDLFSSLFMEDTASC